jgi:2-aminoadipate transaminase
MNPFTSAQVRGLIETGGLDENIEHLRTEYSLRRNALDAALRQHLPAAEYTLPQGGFFFWVRLPGVDASELRRRAREFQVDLRQGELFSSHSGLQEYFRLSFCYYGQEALEEGARRIRDALEKQSNQTGQA